jgi:hypothetical protein
MEREASEHHGRGQTERDAIEDTGLEEGSVPMEDVEQLPSEGMQVEDV